jgi:phage terminase large subunit-like protein
VRSSSERFYYDREEAARAVFFIEEYCRHVKGPLKGRPFRLMTWQKKLVWRLFGWKRPDGTRRFRYVWLETPRKSGKTSFGAALGLYMLFVDPEPGAEIVVASGGAQQASLCFNIAKGMVESDLDLSAVCRTTRRAIDYKDAQFRFLSSRMAATFGANISCLIFDDLHVQRSRELHDVLITGVAARHQPLTLYLTTAGWDRSSLCWELHEYAMKVRNRVVDDPSWLVWIAAADADDDWTDPTVWRKAHPGLGTTIAASFLKQECGRARNTPGFINTFRRLYLNVWTDATAPWLDMELWDRCGTVRVDPERLRGRACRIGLDLSSTTDLTALVLMFPDPDGGYTVLPFAFCPSEGVRERALCDQADYPTWRDQGYLRATEGNLVDHNEIYRFVRELAFHYRIEEVVYDRWNASMLVSQLVADGFSCVPVSQGAGAMDAPARELERLITQGRLRHGGHPVLRWCAANAVVETNDQGEMKPTKRKSNGRIDVLVATLMALQRYVMEGSLPRYKAVSGEPADATSSASGCC